MSEHEAAAPPRTPPEGFAAEFDRIEAAVDAGQTDLRALGFWRLLARVKADPALSAHWAEQAGRIDRKAFEARVRVRVPVWFGNALLLGGALLGIAAVAISITTESQTLAGLALVFAALDWSVTWHSPSHWLVGRLVGIRFTCYFVGRVIPPIPGLKTDYATYLRTPPDARAWMHASGAVASKLAPIVAWALWPVSRAPGWAAWAIVGYAALIVLVDVFLSTRFSDWKRVRRELQVARRQRAAR
ncbi:MAG TPA: hypothetical protein VJ913_11205 [Actinomycetota bacterium]|nr:hypothetical protein [Actinomycetota bacterium]